MSMKMLTKYEKRKQAISRVLYNGDYFSGAAVT